MIICTTCYSLNRTLYSSIISHEHEKIIFKYNIDGAYIINTEYCNKTKWDYFINFLKFLRPTCISRSVLLFSSYEMIEYANVMICYHSHHSTLGQAKAYKYSVWYKLEIYLVLWAVQPISI